MTPQETDIALAQLYYERLTLELRVGQMETAMKHVAGAEFYYRGRKRVTDMTMEDAERRIADALRDPPDDFLHQFKRGYSTLRAEVQRLEKTRELLGENRSEYERIDSGYTGWARYFLTISSRGHIHTSMVCSSCRPMTVFGWLPHLAGKGEIAVVEEHGPTLCSVCFPGAPAEWKREDIPRDEALRRLRAMAELLNLKHQDVFVRRYGERR